MTNQSNEKSKNGKRLALILLALLLIAAIAFGAYTYSKYVTQTEGSGTATVAKWGYTVTIGDTQTHTDDFGFSKNYSNLGQAQDSATGAVISTVRSNNVVAPGAKGSITFTISGKAEVQASVSIGLTNVSKTDDPTDIVAVLSADGKTLEYHPVLFSVTKDKSAVEGAQNITLSELQSYLENLSDTEIAPNEAYAKQGEYVISWQWAFTRESLTLTDSAKGGVELSEDDVNVLDTMLGQLVNGTVTQNTLNVSGTNWTLDEGNSSASMELSLNISIEQTMQQPAGD